MVEVAQSKHDFDILVQVCRSELIEMKHELHIKRIFLLCDLEIIIKRILRVLNKGNYVKGELVRVNNNGINGLEYIVEIQFQEDKRREQFVYYEKFLLSIDEKEMEKWFKKELSVDLLLSEVNNTLSFIEEPIKIWKDLWHDTFTVTGNQHRNLSYLFSKDIKIKLSDIIDHKQIVFKWSKFAEYIRDLDNNIKPFGEKIDIPLKTFFYYPDLKLPQLF